MREEYDEELGREVVLAILTNDTFINEVLMLADRDPAKFRHNLRDLIQRAFMLELPKDEMKVQAVLMAINLAVKSQVLKTDKGDIVHIDIVPIDDIRKEQFRPAGRFLIENFAVENLEDFTAIMEQAALNIEDTPPAIEAPISGQIRNKGRPLPTIPTAKQAPSAVKERPPVPPWPVNKAAPESTQAETTMPVRPLPKEATSTATESVRPPPPNYVPHSPKFADMRNDLLAEIKNVNARYQQFTVGEGGLDLAKKYLNTNIAVIKSKHLNTLIKELGLENVPKMVESMVAEALKEKKPVDVRSVQADIKEVIGLLQAARDRIHGADALDCAKAAHAVIDKITTNLQGQSEEMMKKAEKPDLLNRFLQKRERDKPSSETEERDETPSKRGSGSFKSQ